MKPLGHSNLGVILTFGVPTTVILLGLFWLLRRKRDRDDDDDKGAAKAEPSTVDASEKKKQDASKKKKHLAERALWDGGDSVAQGRENVNFESMNCRLNLNNFQQHQKQASGDQMNSELQTNLSELNSITLECVPPSACPRVTALLSDHVHSVHKNPAGEEMVAESSPVSSLDVLQPTIVSYVTSSIGSAAETCDPSELSLQPEWSLLGDTEMAVKLETSRVEEHTWGTLPGSLASTSTQPSSTQCSLHSESGNVNNSKAMEGDVTSSDCCSQPRSFTECWSQPQSLGVCSSGDSFALAGHSVCDQIAVEDTTSECVSKTCQAPHSSVAMPELTSSHNQSSLSGEAEAAKPEELEAVVQDENASQQPANKLEQLTNSYQSSVPEQLVVDVCESSLEPVVDVCNSSLEPVVDVFESSLEPVVDVCESSLQPVVDVCESSLQPVVDVCESSLQPVVDVCESSLQPVVNVCKSSLEPVVDVCESSLQPVVDVCESSLQPVVDVCESSLQQVVDVSESSLQPVVHVCESSLPSEKAAVGIQEECRSSNVCSPLTAKSQSVSYVPNTTANEDSSSSGGDFNSNINSSGDIEASAPIPTASSANVEAFESFFQDPAYAVEQSTGTTDTSEGKATELQDSVGNQDNSINEELNQSSSSVSLQASSTNSSANSSAPATHTGKTAPKKDRNKKSDSKDCPKTSNKDTPKTSKSQKNASPQSKSASPSKSKQSSPAKAGSIHSRKTKNQSASEGGSSQHDSVGRAVPAVAENGRMDSGSPVCDTNSEASNDSGRGGSVGDALIPSGGDLVHYDFNFPSELCGRLIGRGGKNIQYIKDQSGALVTLSSNPFTPEFQICHVQGLQGDVDRALMMIRKKFPLALYPRLDMALLTPQPPLAPIMLPEFMQLSLPEGVSIDVVVSAVVNAGHVFIQQPTHPSFPSLERLTQLMNACYGDPNAPTPSLPRPFDAGIICASEADGQWYRIQVMQVYPAENECDIKYMDYGGYNRVPIDTIKQIRSDFMTLPFQAVECYLANVTPLQEEEYFSEKAAEVLIELTSGQMLQGQLVTRGEGNIGYVHLYRVSGHKVLMINREMVNREVVRWIEVL